MRFVPAAALAALVAVSCTVNALAFQADTTKPRSSSVGDGNGAAPAISSAVRSAASRAGCRVRSFKSEGAMHGLGTLSYPQIPAVSGTHNGRWADWGLYERKVPAHYQVHNLEHGGVIVHVGSGLSDQGAEGLAELFTAEPGYLLIVPPAASSLKPAEPKLRLRAFPKSGFVVTSWQRRLVCKRATARSLRALTVFTRAYRGRGPEGAPAVNSTMPRPADLPKPSQAAPAPDAA